MNKDFTGGVRSFQKNFGLKRHLTGNQFFILFNAAFLAIFFIALSKIFESSWSSEYFSYIPFIPVISGYLLYENRAGIFLHNEPPLRAAGALALCALLIALAGRSVQAAIELNDYLSLMTAALIMLWIGGFAASYGIRSMRAAAFPLLFLFFAVPLPAWALDPVIGFLQRQSADAAHLLFQAAGIPVAREGLFFQLPELEIEVAKQCSGIRSSLSLLITAVLAGNLFLRSGWSRLFLAVSAVPITILKNGIRIFILSVLGAYVDIRILTESSLHNRGGFIFFLLALLLVASVTLLLKKAENRTARKNI